MSQAIKNYVHPSVARARKEAALECAKIAAEVSRAGGSAERVRAVILERFGLSSSSPDKLLPSDYQDLPVLEPNWPPTATGYFKSTAPADLILPSPTPAPKSREKP